MRRLRISREAQRDLFSIADYSEREWGADAKLKYMDRIATRFESLRRHPNLGRPRTEFGPSLFSILCGGHIIFYRVTDNEVKVVRVLHQRMDFGAHFH
jgi:toxin ParE1/3/4